MGPALPIYKRWLMAKRVLFFGFIVAISAFAHAAPSVWQQMEKGITTSNRGVVKSVDIVGGEIYFKTETQDAFGDKVIREDRLCTWVDGIQPGETDQMQAALFKAKLDMVQDSRKSGKPIEFGTRGAWKSCVSFLRSLDS